MIVQASPTRARKWLAALLGVTLLWQVVVADVSCQEPGNAQSRLARYFVVPPEFDRADPRYESAWIFADGRRVATVADWQQRRAEILKYWHSVMGEWPPLIEKPHVELGAKEPREGLTQFAVKIETAPGRIVEDAYLLLPAGPGPFPAVLVVYYEAKTGIGRGMSEHRDFALQLARRGFVTLSFGGRSRDVLSHARKLPHSAAAVSCL